MACSTRYLFRISVGIVLILLCLTWAVNYIENWLSKPEYMNEPPPKAAWNEYVYIEPETETRFPIIVWWIPFPRTPRIIRKCSQGTCLFTNSRPEIENPLTESILFYGTGIEWDDLPLPRNSKHTWNLLHEESPKNNWILATEEGIGLFNYTSTCSRYSSYPLVSIMLESLKHIMTPLKYSTSEKSKGDYGLVMYLNSGCDTLSDRDSYVIELMKYVKVDSYGKCVHNKDLPEHLIDPGAENMEASDLMDIISHYKFVLSFENAICEDYITEKLWRTLEAGSVPVYKGSPSVIDWAPNDHSIILVDDFSSPQVLANYLLDLDKNDTEYEKYLEYKIEGIINQRLLEHMNRREWAVTDMTGLRFNPIEGFECYVCNKVHEQKRNMKQGIEQSPDIANISHFNCSSIKPAVKVSSYEDLKHYHGRLHMSAWKHQIECSELKAKVIVSAIHAGYSKEEVSTILKHTCDDLYISDDWMITD